MSAVEEEIRDDEHRKDRLNILLKQKLGDNIASEQILEETWT